MNHTSRKLSRKILIGITVLALLIFALAVPAPSFAAASGASAENDSASSSSSKTTSTTFTYSYSNLYDKASQKKVSRALSAAGISQKNISNFLKNVNNYNQTIKGTGLVKSGFKTMKNSLPKYNDVKQSQLWEKKYSSFPGNNCRITAYSLLNGKISVKNYAKDKYTTLFLDKEALSETPYPFLSAASKKQFLSFYAPVTTTLTKNQTVHEKKLLAAWKKRGVSFKTGKAELISVVMHSYFSRNEDYLFIGHTGVLVKSGSGYLFIEKLSFESPYQAVKFSSKKDLKVYLLKTYDVDQNQPTAHPFIMENNKML
ncbi:MAG: DUF4300 family protein [Eubacterium sp.]